MNTFQEYLSINEAHSHKRLDEAELNAYNFAKKIIDDVESYLKKLTDNLEDNTKKTTKAINDDLKKLIGKLRDDIKALQ